MDTFKAWQVEQAPILSRLPEVYRENEVSEYLTSFWDDFLVSTKTKIDDIPRQLDPALCDDSWLDFLAPLCGFEGIYWNKYWENKHKRNLLINSYINIWNNKGSRKGLSTILLCFEIPHAITSKGDFIFGSSKLGEDKLGKSAWEYTIYLNTVYRNTPTVNLVKKLNNLFGPCWCKYEILFDDIIVQNWLDLNDTELILYTLF